MYFQNIARFI